MLVPGRVDPRKWKELRFFEVPQFESQNHQFTITIIGSMGLVCLPTFTIEINQMQVNMPYMDPWKLVVLSHVSHSQNPNISVNASGSSHGE